MHEVRAYLCDHPTGPHMVGCVSRAVREGDIARAMLAPMLAKRVLFHGPLPPAPLSDVEEIARVVLLALIAHDGTPEAGDG